MKKIRFSSEILCLFFIVSVTILFGKILVDVKNVISVKLNQLIPQPIIVVEYQAYSYKLDKVYDNLAENNVIRNKEELDDFKNKLKEEKINISWLNKKLENYDETSFTDKTLVILNLVNDDNVTITRINGISKKNNDLTIGVTKKVKNYEASEKYTWIAILEVSDVGSQILLDISKV